MVCKVIGHTDPEYTTRECSVLGSPAREKFKCATQQMPNRSNNDWHIKKYSYPDQIFHNYFLMVSVGKYLNSWDPFVYPAAPPAQDKEIVVTQQMDEAMQVLSTGGKVLLTLKKGALKPTMGGDIQIGFSSIFWNTAWTNS